MWVKKRKVGKGGERKGERVMAVEALLGNKTRLILTLGDITEQDTVAVVNAANSTLMGGGGVDGAIHRKGGPQILEECKKIREKDWPDGLPAGNAVITTSGRLKAKFVIHAVGPKWGGGKKDEARLLRKTYLSCLEIASSHRLESLSFPSISTGAFSYPIALASREALSTVKEFSETRKDHALKEVRFVLFTESDLRVYEHALEQVLAS